MSVMVADRSLVWVSGPRWQWVTDVTSQGHRGGRAVVGAEGSQGHRERLQLKLCLSLGCQDWLLGSDPFWDHGIVEYFWKNPLRPLSPTVPLALPSVPKCHIHRWHVLVL